jgi:hypothetical protein
MARIRTIKPDFWTSAQIMECSTNARLMFIGMWNFADDAGRMPLSAKTIKAQIFPSDDITSDYVLGMIGELSENGLILIYSIDDKEYLQITGWHHQRIDKPQPSRCPPPPKDNSGNAPRTFPPYRKGRDRKGREEDSVASQLPPSGGASGSKPEIDPPPEPGTVEEIASEMHRLDKPADAQLFARGREVLGKGCGGLIADLKKHFGGSVALARASLEQASTKHDPREYIGAIIRGKREDQADKAHLASGLWDRGL